MHVALWIYISVSEDYLNLANSAEPYKMPPNASFHLGLHHLPVCWHTSIKNEKGLSKCYISLSYGAFWHFLGILNLVLQYLYHDASVTAADISSSKLATGSGINIPTPIPHSLPSILPPQIVPTIPIKKPSSATPGQNTPNIHIPTPVTQKPETTGSVGDNSSTTGNFTGVGITQKQTGTYVIVTF